MDLLARSARRQSSSKKHNISNPNQDALLWAIAIVMHAQIQNKDHAMKKESQGRYIVFGEDDHVEVKDDPTTVRNWIKHFHKHAQLEDDVLLITVIYFERLVSTRKITLNSKTFRAVILVSLLIASKIWDDVSMENGDFAAIADWNLYKVNELEILALEALDWRCTVTAGEYTTYFFKLRSIIGTWGVLGKLESRCSSDDSSSDEEDADRVEGKVRSRSRRWSEGKCDDDDSDDDDDDRDIRIRTL